MFHQGDLQSGIALAIQQKKSVACFVRDDSDTSDVWEHGYLTDDEVSQLLQQHAVTLKLEAGSQEAGFLSAFCPLQETPAVVIIHNGQLKDHIHGSIEEEDLRTRMKAAFGAGVPGAHNSQIQEAYTSAAAQAQFNEQSGTAETAPTVAPTSTTRDQSRLTWSNPSAQPASRPYSPSAPQSQPLSRPSVPQSSRDATPQDSGKGKGRADLLSKKEEESRQRTLAAAAEVRKKRQERDVELQRIQANIERDKEARRLEKLLRQRERESAASGLENDSSATRASPAASSVPRTKRSAHANIQVRLFSGDTIRRTFPSSTNLSDIRSWIDSEIGTSTPPYSFRVMQPPLPTRELSASDESKDMLENDLCPSATLVLMAIGGFTEAYNENNAGLLGTVQWGVRSIFGLAGSAVGAVTGAVGGILNASPQQEQTRTNKVSRVSQEEARPEQPPGGSGGIRVRTLADQRRENKDDPQLYNGNQLNFQRKKDDDEE